MARNLDVDQHLSLTSDIPYTSFNESTFKSSISREQLTSESIITKTADLTTTISSIAQDVRNSFNNGLSKVCESYVSNRLRARLRMIARSGRKAKKSQVFLFSEFGESLAGFEFNSKYPFHEVFRSKYYITPGSNRGHLILHYPAFVPKDNLKAPKEATHFKLYSQLMLLSDFDYCEEDGYKPLNKKLHGKKAEFSSQMLPILKFPLQPITSQLSVNNGLGVPESSGLLLIMGIHFYQYDQGKFAPLSEESSLEIVKVY